MSRPKIPGGYNDPKARGNTAKKHKRPGSRCIEQPCDEIPGTAWSHLWCVKHNIARMDRVSDGINAIVASFEPPPEPR